MGERLRHLHARLSGRLDAAEPLPPPGRVQAWLLPVADWIMIAMLSRSRGGSLRTVRVTMTTIWLAAIIALGGGWVGLSLLWGGLSTMRVLPIALGMGAVTVALGAGALALYGILQRRAISRHAGGR
jgi:hypothetical protein